MVVTSFSCTSCCFFSSADFQVCACPFSIHNCNITCLVFLMWNVQLFLSLLSDALLSGYKLHHHFDPERTHGVCKSKCEVHGADMNAVQFLHVLWILCIYMPSSSQRHNVSWSGSKRAQRCEQNPGVAPLLCSLPKSISCLVEIQEWSLLSQACCSSLDEDTIERLPKNKSRGFCRRRAAWPVKMISYMGSCSLACSRHKEAALSLSQCLMPSLLCLVMFRFAIIVRGDADMDTNYDADSCLQFCMQTSLWSKCLICCSSRDYECHGSRQRKKCELQKGKGKENLLLAACWHVAEDTKASMRSLNSREWSGS